MVKKSLIIVSMCALVLLILASLSNVIGYQTVQTLQQNHIKERTNQKELLFKTIIDIVNNKEMQRIILKSQMTRRIFAVSEIPLLPKDQLKRIFFLSLILSKVISKSRIQSMVQQYQVMNPKIHQEICTIIEKDAALNDETTQLQNSKCNCENNTGVTSWSFPVICGILGVLVLLFILIVANTHFGNYTLVILLYLYNFFNCV